MDLALYRHAIEQLNRLRDELQGRPTGNAYSPARSEAAHRLVELAKKVAEAANGCNAAAVLREKAERYEAETGPGTRLEQLARDALSALAQARGGHSYLMYDEASGVLEDLFPDTPGASVPPTAGRSNALPGCCSLPICSHLGFTNDGCPRPTPDELESRWATVTAVLEDPLTARRLLPLLLCGLEEIAACLPGRSQLAFTVEQLYQWLCNANARQERGAYLIWQCQHGSGCEPDDEGREDLTTILSHMLPGCLGEVVLAAESLAPDFTTEQKVSRKAESPSGEDQRRTDPLDGPQTLIAASIREAGLFPGLTVQKMKRNKRLKIEPSQGQSSRVSLLDPRGKESDFWEAARRILATKLAEAVESKAASNRRAAQSRESRRRGTTHTSPDHS